MVKKARKCIAKGCGDHAYIRGLCTRHYAAANRQVNSGSVTWEQLEAEGLAEPSRRTGPRTPYGKQVEAVAEGKK